MSNQRHTSDAGDELLRPGTHPLGQAATDRGFDEDGVARLSLVTDWLVLDLAPKEILSSRQVLALLRFSRTDGSPVFGPLGRSPERLARLGELVRGLGDPSLLGILGSWTREATPPTPLPVGSDARRDRPLGVLRPDWSARGDLVAFDHRRAGDETLVEFGSRGVTWLGPGWSSAPASGRATLPLPSAWSSGLDADHAEWSYKQGPRRVIRCVVVLKGRSMALLGHQDEGGELATEIRVDLAKGVEASFVAGSRAILLSAGRGRPTARLIPLGLPAHERPTEAGSIGIEGRQVVIRHRGEGRRRWISALLCWGKPPTTWRPATVAERSKACRPGLASAVRVAWGPRDEGLVVYRSLGPAALRSFLGHQTAARFLIGAFTRSGDIRPLLKVDA